MCFTPKISATFAVLGAVMTFIAYNVDAYREEYFYIITGFYTLMELLQTIQYAYVNQCGQAMNWFLTEIAYILLIVQPLLWNWIFYLRVTRKEDKQLFKLAMVLCGIWIVGNVYARFGFDPKKDKNSKQCGFISTDQTCTFRSSDSSHLYWTFQTRHFRDLNANYFMYFVLWFVPALFVLKTRLSSIFLMISAWIGLMLSWKYSATMLEFPSIWCYISLPVIIGGFLKIYIEKISTFGKRNKIVVK